MRKTTKLLTLVMAMAAFSLLGLGCESSQHADDSYGDHPQGSADHPEGAVPKADHPKH